MKLELMVIRNWAAAVVLAGLMLPALVTADEWNGVEEFKFDLFPPGQASWEWLLIPTDHGASPARRMREGRPCLSCHQGEEAVIGNATASGERLESHPIVGMPATLELSVKGQVTDGQLRLRLSWPIVGRAEPAGTSDFAAKVTTLIADDAVSTAHAATCWASCHSDLPGMSDDAGKDLTKYLPNSRQRMTRTGGGDAMKSAAELAEELDKGAFLEYWTAYLHSDASVETRDGYFLEARIKNEDSVAASTARREDNRWVVEITRPLAPASGPRKQLEPGQTYPISFAIHESHTEGRRHYVSFPLAIRVGEEFIRIEEVLE